ncbi:hypothetical protein Bbelb_217800 [Branchiostoma belcheri]|nr:hypothetical protein Bbelb_217800 [Branchiostoma belcheri]
MALDLGDGYSGGEIAGAMLGGERGWRKNAGEGSRYSPQRRRASDRSVLHVATSCARVRRRAKALYRKGSGANGMRRNDSVPSGTCREGDAIFGHGVASAELGSDEPSHFMVFSQRREFRTTR